jgi:hypothetical protein
VDDENGRAPDPATLTRMIVSQVLPPTPLPPFTRRTAGRLGVSPDQLDALVRDGRVVQPVRGAYLDVRAADTPEQRAAAAALVLPTGTVATRRLAAWLHGVDPRGPSEQGTPIPLEFLADVGRQVRRNGVRVHQSGLRPDDVTGVHGVPVTTLDRTACDLARYLPPHMGLAVLDALAHQGRIDPAVLLERIEEWRGERWTARARRLIDLCEPDTESYGESWTRLRMVDAGFPRPEPQILITDEHGVVVYRLDMGWRDKRVAVEYDGVEFHSEEDDVAHDERRRKALADEFDWHVVGVGRGLVLGRSLELELGVGELLGLEPQIRTRLW